jgi:hypothetical protein
MEIALIHADLSNFAISRDIIRAKITLDISINMHNLQATYGPQNQRSQLPSTKSY